MRGTCSICTELFDEKVGISAVLCGHTFHEVCLARWLKEDKSCPQCRKKCTASTFISKLYWNEEGGGDEEPVVDVNKLKNELESARLAVRLKEKEKADLVSEQNALKMQVSDMTNNCRSIQIQHREEVEANHSLRRELAFHKRLQTEAETAKDHAKTLSKKLDGLRAVENLIKGGETEVQDMIDKESDIRQMALWCSVLQKEMSMKRQQCRALREETEKYKKEVSLKSRALRATAGELAVCKEQSRHVEEDLKNSEHQVSSLKKKIEVLQKALGSPSATASSFAHRLIHESPAPCPSAKRPKLSSPETPGGELNITLDLFPSPINEAKSCIAEPSPTTQTKNDCKEYGTKFIKITTAGQKAEHQNKKDIHDISNIPGALGSFNLFKKKTGSGVTQPSSFLKLGYNGLGGHEKFVKPLPRPKALPKKRVAKPATSSARLPPLPTLNGFITLD